MTINEILMVAGMGTFVLTAGYASFLITQTRQPLRRERMVFAICHYAFLAVWVLVISAVEGSPANKFGGVPEAQGALVGILIILSLFVIVLLHRQKKGV